MTKLLPLNEITGAILAPQLSQEDVKAISADAAGFIKAKADLDITSDIKIVENSGNDIHLALPYYSTIETMQSEMVQDENMDGVAGGEILISIFAGIGVAIGVGAGVAAGAGVTTGVALAVTGGIIGGITGAAVAGTATAAIYQGKHGKNIDGSKK